MTTRHHQRTAGIGQRRVAVLRMTAWIVGLLVWCSGVCLAVSESPSWVFVVHPFDTPSRVYMRFRPLVNYLADELGRPIRLHVASDYEEQIHMLAEGSAQLAYIGPTPYVRAREKAPIRIVAGETANGQAFYQSVIVVKDTSPLRKLTDLRGARLALGAEISFSSAVVPRYMLQQAGLRLSDMASVAYLHRHEQVALAVLHGDYDAGGLRLEIANAYLPRGLRIIATSQPLPPHVIAAAAQVPDAEIDRVKTLLLTPTPKRQAALAALGENVGFVEIDDHQYDAVRRLLKAIEP